MRDVEKHPWVLGALRIRKDVLDRVYDEARKGYENDEESCGVLRGPASDPLLVDEIVPMVNRAAKLHELDPITYPRTARTYFDVDPLKFQRIIDAGERDGRPVKILYHSHLDAGAYFSETDAQAATMGGPEPAFDLAYLVTSVVKGHVGEHALFIWDPSSKRFVDSPLYLA
jgi:proteasome lid subunit RPN8/RPN11